MPRPQPESLSARTFAPIPANGPLDNGARAFQNVPMFEQGEKVVCVDDRFHPEIAYLYTALPVKGKTYTVRECEMGRAKWVSAQKGWDSVDMKVLLVELVNPVDPSTSKGCPSELGFAARRFAPLDSLTDLEEAESRELVPAGY